MVVFACNHCGESVKKNQVDRHYQFKCRNAPVFVSCMDCQKDFKEKEYEAHTSCITEAEKYSGKDYVPKASQNAGQRKQEDWIDIVRSVLSSTEQNVSGQARRHLQKLLDYSNVPRKKPKFINFVGNSLRINPKEAKELWNIMEVAIDKFKSRNQKKPKNEAPPTADEEPEVKSEVNGTEAVNTPDDKAEKKKKKKRQAEEATETEVTAENTEEAPAKKKKKKSKESEAQEENGQENESGVANGTAETTETETGKKKKKKSKNTEADETITENGDAVDEVEDETPKKKKKRSEQVEEAPVKANVPSNNRAVAPPNANKPFDWTNAIFDVVEKNDNEIDADKLKKKVLKKYQKIHQVETIPWKVEKTFNKKLKKSGLLVEGNLVKTRIK